MQFSVENVKSVSGQRGSDSVGEKKIHLRPNVSTCAQKSVTLSVFEAREGACELENTTSGELHFLILGHVCRWLLDEMSESLPKTYIHKIFASESQKDSKLAFLWPKTVDGTPKPLQGYNEFDLRHQHQAFLHRFWTISKNQFTEQGELGGAQPAISKNTSGIISAGRAKRSIAQPDDVRERFRQLKEQEKRNKKNKTVAKDIVEPLESHVWNDKKGKIMMR
ncbi:unnamed protein product [Arabis nemorensis]|uniref:Uncharacterized protein n=1 Tax=Arabis nemorensis TaxID=586526 RepID=A0A565CRG3_9BRAS|nr:unnamed protein product [Arabis nemorensis]